MAATVVHRRERPLHLAMGLIDRRPAQAPGVLQNQRDIQRDAVAAENVIGAQKTAGEGATVARVHVRGDLEAKVLIAAKAAVTALEGVGRPGEGTARKDAEAGGALVVEVLKAAGALEGQVQRAGGAELPEVAAQRYTVTVVVPLLLAATVAGVRALGPGGPGAEICVLGATGAPSDAVSGTSMGDSGAQTSDVETGIGGLLQVVAAVVETDHGAERIGLSLQAGEVRGALPAGRCPRLVGPLERVPRPRRPLLAWAPVRSCCAASERRNFDVRKSRRLGVTT